MTFHPIGVVVMISGPGDTSEEVAAVREVIGTWNGEHSVTEGVVFVPKHFSTNTVPIYRKGGDGQAVINEQVTSDSDIVIALFKHRLGTPTPRNSQSGTVEEADLKEADGTVHVYFWGGDVPQEVARGDEWKRLGEFRDEFHANTRGLYASYNSPADLRQQVERALWEDARSIAALASAGAASVEGADEQKPSNVPSATVRSDVQVTIDVTGAVWSCPEVNKMIDAAIERDIGKEREWAAKQGESKNAVTVAIARSKMTTGAEPRSPKTDAEIKQWADSVRARADHFHENVAGAVGTPLLIRLNSNKFLERVEVEIAFENVRGADPSKQTWSEIWTPLHTLPRNSFGASTDSLTYIPDARRLGALQSRWSQVGSDVVLRLNLGELRNRLVPTEFDDAVILWVRGPDLSDDQTGYTYTWRASAAGTDEEWNGIGQLQAVDKVTMKTAMRAWLAP